MAELASKAGATLAKIRRVMPLPVGDEFIVRANGAAQFAAGAALALGIKPRLSAAVLAGSLLPTTVAGHAFWTIADPTERRAQQLQFLKNLAMLGGLLRSLRLPTIGLVISQLASGSSYSVRQELAA